MDRNTKKKKIWNIKDTDIKTIKSYHVKIKKQINNKKNVYKIVYDKIW